MPRTGGRATFTVAAIVVALGLASLLLPSTATYDPWAWIVWGREVVHGDLTTATGPSWKPLPVVITSLAAPFGSIAPDVWIVVARIGAIAAIVLAFQIGRRLAGPLAGFVAAAPLAVAPWWFWNAWLANSEALLVAFVLGAIAAELAGRRPTALACGIAAGLLRPEAWPFLLLYAGWLAWRAGWRDRAAIAAALTILPLAWLLPEKWGSGDYWRAATRAQNPDPGAASLTDHPWLTIVGDFVDMLPPALWAVVAVWAAVAVWALVRGRGDGTPATADVAPDGPEPARRVLLAALWIAGLGLAWLAVVAVMTERGYSGNERYLISPLALIALAAALLLGLGLRRLPRPATAVVAGAVVAVVAVTAIVDLPDQVDRVFYESRLVDDLPNAIEQAGGADRLRACAPVITSKFMVPQTAWQMREHAQEIGYLHDPPYGVLLRLRIREGGGIEPRTDGYVGLRRLARTKYWDVQAACRPGQGEAR